MLQKLLYSLKCFALTEDFLVEWKALTSCLTSLGSITCIINGKVSQSISLPEILSRISSKDGGSCVLKASAVKRRSITLN